MTVREGADLPAFAPFALRRVRRSCSGGGKVRPYVRVDFLRIAVVIVFVVGADLQVRPSLNAQTPATGSFFYKLKNPRNQRTLFRNEVSMSHIFRMSNVNHNVGVKF